MVAGTLLLTGCSSESHSDYGEYLRLLRESWKGSFGNGAVTRADAAAIPYASMGIRLDGEHEALIVLATDSDGNQLWTSRAHIVVETIAGRIKRTVGLPQDISGVTPLLGQNQLTPPAQALREPFDSRRSVDFPNQNIFGVQLNCHTAVYGNQNIAILGHTIATVRVNETCRALGWNFTDFYWVDRENGFVWKSVQHLHPKGETLAFEIFRPPG